MNDDQTFRLEEYKSLRKEVELYLTESRSQERYTLVAVGAIWGWLIINHLNTRLLWGIPIVLTVAVSLRMFAILRHFSNIGKYIRKLEVMFGVEGWEQQKRPLTLGGAYVLLSVVLIALTVVAYHYRSVLAGAPCPVCSKAQT